MKQFIKGFIVGTIIMIFASRIWGFMPTFLGGRIDYSEPDPFVACHDLVKDAKDFGNVEVVILNNGKPEVNLEVDLSAQRPPPLDHPGGAEGEFGIPQRLCAQNTNLKGAALFKNVPASSAYIFFNNDVNNYFKRFSKFNFSVVTVEVKKGETVQKTIELKQKK